MCRICSNGATKEKCMRIHSQTQMTPIALIIAAEPRIQAAPVTCCTCVSKVPKLLLGLKLLPVA